MVNVGRCAGRGAGGVGEVCDVTRSEPSPCPLPLKSFLSILYVGKPSNLLQYSSSLYFKKKAQGYRKCHQLRFILLRLKPCAPPTRLKPIPLPSSRFSPSSRISGVIEWPLRKLLVPVHPLSSHLISSPLISNPVPSRASSLTSSLSACAFTRKLVQSWAHCGFPPRRCACGGFGVFARRPLISDPEELGRVSAVPVSPFCQWAQSVRHQAHFGRSLRCTEDRPPRSLRRAGRRF
jgi:hypothetical protein